MTNGMMGLRRRKKGRGGVGRRHGRGFTLIELMIVVAVIAILAGIAYASYDNAVIKSRRSAAAACMLESAQFMERFYTTNLRYDQAVGGGGGAVALPPSQCRTDLANHYTIALVPAAVTATSYGISAVPQGRQATKDTKCATLGLDNTGTKTVSGSSSVADCW